MEYGCCGLSEEDAIKLYGEDKIETYLFEFGSLEHQVRLWLGERGGETWFIKITVFCTENTVDFCFLRTHCGTMSGQRCNVE